MLWIFWRREICEVFVSDLHWVKACWSRSKSLRLSFFPEALHRYGSKVCGTVN